MHTVESLGTPKILFVDDEMSVLKALKRFSRSNGWNADFANSGADALSLAEEESYDMVISDMRMPQMTGAELLSEMKRRHPDTVRILLTGYSDMDALEQAVNESGIFNYITKPWNDFVLQEVVDNGFKWVCNHKERERLEELTQYQNKKLSRLALLLDKQLKESKMETKQAQTLLECQQEVLKKSAMESLAIVTNILDWNEGRDRGHANFVEEYSVKMAHKLDFSEYDIEQLRLASILHRIGILGLPEDLRNKPAYNLNKDERKLYNRYPEMGEIVLSNSSQLTNIGRIIRHHQEYVNGTGYPDQIALNDIPMSSKIICLVGDFYDVCNGRKERSISGVKEAKEYINTWSGKRYDASLVKLFNEIICDFKYDESTSKIVSTSLLKEGDVLNENIVTKNGLLLLRTGTKITRDHIERLLQYQDGFEEAFEIDVVSNEVNKLEEMH